MQAGRPVGSRWLCIPLRARLLRVSYAPKSRRLRISVGLGLPHCADVPPDMLWCMKGWPAQWRHPLDPYAPPQRKCIGCM